MGMRRELIVGEVAIPVVGVLEKHYEIVYWQIYITDTGSVLFIHNMIIQ